MVGKLHKVAQPAILAGKADLDLVTGYRFGVIPDAVWRLALQRVIDFVLLVASAAGVLPPNGVLLLGV